VKLQFISALLILISLAGIFFFRHFLFSDVMMHILFCLLIISIGIITGAQFHLASILNSGDINKVAATNYSADLIGSAAGAVLINAWIVPSFGFIASLLVVAGVNVCVIIYMLIKKLV
jgi:hypothetical protein